MTKSKITLMGDDGKSNMILHQLPRGGNWMPNGGLINMAPGSYTEMPDYRCGGVWSSTGDVVVELRNNHTLDVDGDYTVSPVSIIVNHGSVLNAPIDAVDVEPTEEEQNKILLQQLTIINHSGEQHELVIYAPTEGTRNILNIHSDSQIMPQQVTMYDNGECIIPTPLKIHPTLNIINNTGSIIKIFPEAIREVLQLVYTVFTDHNSAPTIEQISKIRMYENIVKASVGHVPNNHALEWMNQHWLRLLGINSDTVIGADASKAAPEVEISYDVLSVIGSFVDFEHSVI